MVAPIALGAALMGGGTLSKILGKDRDYPFWWGEINYDPSQGKFVKYGKTNVLDAADKEDAVKYQHEIIKGLNDYIKQMPLEQRQNLSIQPFNVGNGAAGRPGAVNKGGLFFGRMDGSNQFLGGIGNNQGYTDINSFFNDLTNYTLGDDVTSKLNLVHSNLDVPEFKSFLDSNFWTKAGTAAQVAGALTSAYGMAQNAGLLGAPVSSGAATAAPVATEAGRHTLSPLALEAMGNTGIGSTSAITGLHTLSPAVEQAMSSTVMDITGNPSSGLGLLDGANLKIGSPGIGQSSAGMVDAIDLGGRTVGDAVGAASGTFPGVNIAGGTTTGMRGAIGDFIDKTRIGGNSVGGIINGAKLTDTPSIMGIDDIPATQVARDLPPDVLAGGDKAKGLLTGLSFGDWMSLANAIGAIGGMLTDDADYLPNGQPINFDFTPFDAKPIQKKPFQYVAPSGGKYQTIANQLGRNPYVTY